MTLGEGREGGEEGRGEGRGYPGVVGTLKC